LVFDYDRDGDLDLVVMNNSGPVRLWRNETGSERGNICLSCSSASLRIAARLAQPSACVRVIACRAA